MAIKIQPNNKLPFLAPIEKIEFVDGLRGKSYVTLGITTDSLDSMAFWESIELKDEVIEIVESDTNAV